MSDTPLGGWWKAKDGKWYPPETHPDHRPTDDAEAPSGPPAAGWWQASDGNWYPPETHPDRSAQETAAPQPTVAAQPAAAPKPAVAPQETFAPQPTVAPQPTAAPQPVVAPPAAAVPTTPVPAPGAGDPDSRRGMFDLGAADAATAGPARSPSASTAAAAAVAAGSAKESAGGPRTSPKASAAPIAAEFDDGDGGDQQPRDRRKLLLVVGSVVAAVLLIAFAALFFLGGGDDADQAATLGTPRSSSTTSTTTTSTSTTTTAPTTTAAPTSTVPVEIPSQVGGTGTATVDVGRVVAEPYLGLITHDGAGSVSIELLGADGDVVQQLVGPGVSGRYLGVVPVNFVQGSSFRSVRFTGEGPWALTFALPESAPTAQSTTGATFRSDGDRVVSFGVTTATRVQLECAQCTSPLVVVPWSAATATQPGPLEVSGDVIVVPAGTTALQITASAAPGTVPAWSITPL